MSVTESRDLFYQRDGIYLHTEPVYTCDEIAAAVSGMDDVRNGIYETGIHPQPSGWVPGSPLDTLCKIEMAHLADRRLHAIVDSPALGKVMAEVTGAEWLQVWWVQLLIKPSQPANTSLRANVGWHQDRQYWHHWSPDSELFTAWVALSDVDEDSGPVRFVLGSQRWGFLDQGDFFGQDHNAQEQEIQPPPGEEWREVAGVLPAGGVSVHHCLTFHASGPNTSGRPRRSLALHMRSANSAPANGKKEGLTQFIDDPRYCPVIFDKNATAKDA